VLEEIQSTIKRWCSLFFRCGPRQSGELEVKRTGLTKLKMLSVFVQGDLLEERVQIDEEMASLLVKSIKFAEASPVDLSLRQRIHESLNTRRKASPARRQRYVQALRARRTPLSDVSSVDYALSKASRGEEVSRLGSYRKAGIYA